MTELRLPAELELQLQQEAESLDLAPAAFVQLLLNTWQLWRNPVTEQVSADFESLIEHAIETHTALLSQQELWG